MFANKVTYINKLIECLTIPTGSKYINDFVTINTLLSVQIVKNEIL